MPPTVGPMAMGDEDIVVVDDAPAEIVITEGPDGLMVEGEFQEQVVSIVDHDGNLAVTMTDSDLLKIGQDVLEWVRTDEQTRTPWKEAYARQMDLLGLTIPEKKTEPFEGACAYFHPMVAEALVRFQSQTIMEIFPAEGPVKTKIVGKVTPDKQAQADRVKQFMNYDLTEREIGYRRDFEKLLWAAGSAGCAFKKTWVYDSEIHAKFVPAEDVLIPYGAGSIHDAARVTQILRPEKHILEQQIASGFYRDVPLVDGIEASDVVREKLDEISRIEDPGVEKGSVLYECSCYLKIEDENGVSLPYLVTVDDRGAVLAIRRNWAEDDPKKKRLDWLTQYDYIIGNGPYGFGQLHVMGGSAQTATGILRQLIDAGSFFTLSGGFKSKDAKMQGGTVIVRPGQWPDVDTSIVDLNKAFFPLPYKEPSAVMAALLDKVVEAGSRVGSIADVDIGDLGAQAPVGTTLALMERAHKVMSAVQARIHAAMHEEFKIRARLYKQILPDTMTYEVEEDERIIHATDFDSRIKVIPVSDPNAATMAQRVTQYSTAIQLSAQAPQVYDLPALHRQMLAASGIRNVDTIVPDKSEAPPMDPVAECMALLTGKPVKAYEWQNHKAHLQVLMALKTSPETAKYVGQSVNANQIASAMDAAIQERYAYLWREEITQKLGVPLPSLDEPLPGEVEGYLSMAVADAAQKALASQQSEAAQQEAQAKAQDPVLQLQRGELEVKIEGVKLDRAKFEAELELKREESARRSDIERMRIEAQAKQASESEISRLELALADIKLEREKWAAQQEMMTAEIEKLRAETKQTQANTLATLDSVGEEDDGPLQTEE